MQKLIADNLSTIRQLLKKHGVYEAYLFGSATNNRFDKQSDVDMLVNFTEKKDFEAYGNNYFNLLYDLQELLERNVDLVAEETLSNPFFIQSINNSKIKLL